MTWQGYPSNEPCAVCGEYYNNQSEPRFGYTVCEDHKGVPPVDIGRLNDKLKGASVEGS